MIYVVNETIWLKNTCVQNLNEKLKKEKKKNKMINNTIVKWVCYREKNYLIIENTTQNMSPLSHEMVNKNGLLFPWAYRHWFGSVFFCLFVGPNTVYHQSIAIKKWLKILNEVPCYIQQIQIIVSFLLNWIVCPWWMSLVVKIDFQLSWRLWWSMLYLNVLKWQRY